MKEGREKEMVENEEKDEELRGREPSILLLPGQDRRRRRTGRGRRSSHHVLYACMG